MWIWTGSLIRYGLTTTECAVLYKTWGDGEYKSCSAVNEETGFELLKCEEVDASKDGGIFTVRFRGRIYVREIHKDWLDWKCRNDGDSADPKITCWRLNR